MSGLLIAAEHGDEKPIRYRAGGRHYIAAILDTRWLPLVFLACALPTGLCLALLTPIGQVPDEPAHIARAAGLLHGQIMGQRVMAHDAGTDETFPLSGTAVNAALVSESYVESPPVPTSHLEPVTPRQARAAAAIPWITQPSGKPPSDFYRQFDPAPNTVQYFPALYLPAALGMALMRHWGGSPLQTLHAGRVGMLLFYLAAGTAAISSPPSAAP